MVDLLIEISDFRWFESKGTSNNTSQVQATFYLQALLENSPSRKSHFY
ncbi:hypothetical protein GGP42_003177 [Salinibacter ruber]|nr:hypothetical protein [Salinibacter ruber]